MKRPEFAILGSLFLLACSSPESRYASVMAALPGVGETVRDFTFPGSAGSPVTRDSIAGGPTLVALWSSTCQGSRMALSALADIERDHPGLKVVVLANDSDPRRVRQVMDSLGVSLAFGYASGELSPVFHSSRTAVGRVIRRATGRANFALPSFLLLDRNGVVRSRSVGVELTEPRLRRVRADVAQLFAT